MDDGEEDQKYSRENGVKIAARHRSPKWRCSPVYRLQWLFARDALAFSV
jgi:hypothetical protein